MGATTNLYEDETIRELELLIDKIRSGKIITFRLENELHMERRIPSTYSDRGFSEFFAKYKTTTITFMEMVK